MARVSVLILVAGGWEAFSSGNQDTTIEEGVFISYGLI